MSPKNAKFRAHLLKAYECRPNLKKSLTPQAYLDAIAARPVRLAAYAAAFQAAADKAVPEFWASFRRRNGVFSTTTHGDNVLMWSHYGDYHRGFRMELDPATAFTQLDGPFLVPIKVAYQDHLPEVKPDHTPNPAWYKHTHWSYEDEWRFIRDVERDPPPQGDADMRLYPVNPEAVRSITFGIAFDAALKVDMATRIQAALPDTKILQAVKAEGSFAIELVDFA